MEVGSTLSVAVSRFGMAWAKKKFGESKYKDIRALGVLKEKETKQKKALITMRFDSKDYYEFTKHLKPEPAHEGSNLCFMNGEGEEVVMDVSSDEEDSAEDQPGGQEEEKQVAVQEVENEEDEEGGDEEYLPSYNPSPFSEEQVQIEREKLLSKGFEWKVGPQAVDWGADRPRHKAKTTMDEKNDRDPLSYALLSLLLFCFLT